MVLLPNSHESHWQPTSSGSEINYLVDAPPLPLSRNSENHTLRPRHIDMTERLSEISRAFAFMDALFDELWLFVSQITQSPVCHYGQSFPSTPQTLDLPLAYPGQPVHNIRSPSADFQPSNEELECLWLSKGTRSPCNRRFASRMDLIDHLSHAHEVNGTAKRNIRCRRLLDVNNLKTTVACPHLLNSPWYAAFYWCQCAANHDALGSVLLLCWAPQLYRHYHARNNEFSSSIQRRSQTSVPAGAPTLVKSRMHSRAVWWAGEGESVSLGRIEVSDAFSSTYSC
ncbi:hypothetical protein EV401DRAFT_2039921 [Pisolithus croceorrhizus]|nr:hypothetical protein EV401DRAFT_2039921 [Pisolithus croceorrhizus]